jgi:stage II sporulation protein AA (anti-sigma F factor antagonist)
MKIIVETLNNKIKITLNIKKFDIIHMQEIKKEINQEIKNNPNNILIDFSNVSFIDSSGLSVIIGIFKQLNILNKELELCGLQEQPIELFELTQLHKLLTIIDNCNS